jgi:hypothetical protein
MATLATMYNRFLGGTRTECSELRPMSAEADESCWLRSLPNEDIYLYVKEIDNTRVVRQPNPREGRAAWKMVGGGSIAAALLISVLIPSAYGVLAGYKVQALRQERDALLREKATLELEESALVSPERLAELALKQQMVTPPPQAIVYADTKPDAKAGALALNVKK